MKQKLRLLKGMFLLACLSFSSSLCSQTLPNRKVIDPFRREFNRALASYNCNSGIYVNQKSFFEIAKQTFAKVIIKDDELVKNGTSSSIAIDKDKSTISGNANMKISNSVYLNLGVGGNAKGRQLFFFQEGGYNKGFTISTGLDIKLHSSIFYNSSDSCPVLTNNRSFYVLTFMNKVITHTALDTNVLHNEIEGLESIAYPTAISNTIPAQTVLTATETLLKSKKDELKFCRDYLYSTSSAIRDSVESLLSAFETKNAPINGYTLHWLNITPQFSNQGYNVFDTSVTARFFDDTLKKKFFRVYSANISYNYVRNTPRSLFYGYVGATIQNQYGLQDFKFKDGALIGGRSAIVEKNSIEALDVTDITGSYNRSYLQFTPQAGGFLFFGKSKTIGIEGFASVAIKSNTPVLIEHRPSYSLRFGPLFSMTRSEGVASTGTLGLFLNIEDMVSQDKIGDVISFSVRVGIPFSNIKALK
jgi:hypothetical protein